MTVTSGRTSMLLPRWSSRDRDAWCAAGAMAAYVISAIKFVNRDPLSTSTGIQGFVEIGAVAVAALLAAVPLVARREWPRLTPPTIWFGVFAALALLSSAFSYWPMLSLIKGGMLVVILFIAAALCTSRPPAEVLGYFYWSAWLIIIIGVCLKFGSREPLFDMDEYSGRIRFTVFALHWGSLADLSALTILVGRLMPRRPHWSCQAMLAVINVATCARWSSASLFLVLLVSTLWQSRVSLKVLSLAAFGVATAALIAWIVVAFDIPVGRVPFERFYGDKVTLDEIATLNGRTGVWVESESMIPGTIVFGYGVEGARAAILREFEWAGHAHNAYLEVLFAGGLPGLMAFLLGWGMAVVRTIRTDTPTRPIAIGLHLYMFTCGLTDPNMTLLQFLPVLLIVCTDAGNRVLIPELLPNMVSPAMAVRRHSALVTVHS